MTGDQAVAEVQQILGWRSDKAVQIMLALGYAQTELERPGMTFPWWLEDVITFTTIVGTPSYTIPDSFIQERELRDGGVVYLTGGILTSRTVFLRKMSLKDAQEAYYGQWPDSGDADPASTFQEIGAGSPRDYVLDGDSIIFYPKPDKVYSILMNAWVKQPSVGTGENAWLKNAPWLLIGMAARKLGADLGNANAITTATAILGEAKDAMFRGTVQRQQSGRSRRMGSKL